MFRILWLNTHYEGLAAIENCLETFETLDLATERAMELLKDAKFPSDYIRLIGNTSALTTIDFGSHTQFFVFCDVSKEEGRAAADSAVRGKVQIHARV